MSPVTETPIWVLWYSTLQRNSNNRLLIRQLTDWESVLVYRLDTEEEKRFVVINLISSELSEYNEKDFIDMFSNLDNTFICTNIVNIPSNNNDNKYFFLTDKLNNELEDIILKLINEKVENNREK